MFGIIPKTMWERILPVDNNNLIPMVTNLFVLKAHNRIFLFDTGLGDTLTDREKKIYGTDGVSMMNDGLKDMGLTPEDIDFVILTHIHTDHAGGAVKEVDGGFVPRFPRAKYVVGRQEWEDALAPDERTSAVYIPKRLQALEKSGQMTFVSADTELFPGIRVVFTGGHTRGHFGLEIESGGTKVFYYADIFCTSAHMKVPFVPASDLYPVATMDIKRRKLPEIIDRDVVMAFDHDIYTPLARIKQEGRQLVVEPVQTGLEEFQTV